VGKKVEKLLALGVQFFSVSRSLAVINAEFLYLIVVFLGAKF
jgi:hypothetical protein